MIEEDFENPFSQTVRDRNNRHPRSAFVFAEGNKILVENYLVEAKNKGFQTVRIIHGKGIGVQRDIVRKVLSETDFVRSFKNAPEFSGSWGSTRNRGVGHLSF